MVMSFILLIPACGGKDKNNGQFPEGFSSLSDEQKVAYMMQHVPADSVARFIIYASLGKVEGVKIDTLNNATLKAYETYTDTALQLSAGNSIGWQRSYLSTIKCAFALLSVLKILKVSA